MSSPLVNPTQPDSGSDADHHAELRVDQAAYDAANTAFERELPELMKLRSYKRRWVLYHCDKRMGIAATQTDLYRLARRRGLPDAEIVIRFITDVPCSTDLDDFPDV